VHREGEEPLNYSKLLNRVLPKTIRVVAWAEVPGTFDARFSCVSRTYRYFFPTRGLDVCRMRTAASLLVGQHDFRNFCKLDVVNVSNFVRTIFVADIVVLSGTGAPLFAGSEAELQAVADGAIGYLEIRGNAFLYHQIRCTVAILLMVASGQEDTTIVTQLLDVAKVSAKPCFTMASELFLVLWDCEFDSAVVRWCVDKAATGAILSEWATVVDSLQLQSAMAASMSGSLCGMFGVEPFHGHTTTVIPQLGGAAAGHVPLMSRPREHSFDDKVAGLSEAKRHRREANVQLKQDRGSTKDRLV